MTRIIKCRAWDGAKMLHYSGRYGTGDTGSPNDMTFFCEDNNTGGKEHELMQFTGLLDKDGKEIYEGDIVNVDEAGKCRVDYLDHSMKFYFQTLEGYDKQFTATSDKVEIIGNIYENSELLK